MRDAAPPAERWTRLAGEDAAAALARARPLLARAPGPHAALHARALPFLPGWVQLAVSDPATRPTDRRYLLAGPDVTVALDYSAGPLDFAERRAPRRLPDARTAAAYLRFRLGAVRGPEGAFHLVEGDDDLAALDGPAVATRCAGLAGPLAPVRAGEGWTAVACLRWEDGLWRATLRLDSEPGLRFEARALLATGLPPAPPTRPPDPDLSPFADDPS